MSARSGRRIAISSTLAVVGAATLTVLAPLGAPPPVHAGSATFTTVGVMDLFTVPAGVTELTLEACGADGGVANGPAGGRGACVTAVLAVTSGDPVRVAVGGKGADASGQTGGAGGTNGGGAGGSGYAGAAGGGGYTWVSLRGTSIAVAGGGGGASPQHAGGDAGIVGAAPLTMEDGEGGGASAGGLGGAGYSTGTSASGMDGGAGASSYGPSVAGGGGGGGLWGGGGGGALGMWSAEGPGGSGGGGSSLAPAGATVAPRASALNGGNGWVTITFTDPSTTTTEAPTTTTEAPATTVGATTTTVASGVELVLGMQVGDAADGAMVDVIGHGLQPGAPYVVTMHSTTVELARGVVPDSGALATLVHLPADVEAGAHSITVTVTGDDTAADTVWFTVDRNGVIIETSTLGPTSDVTALPTTGAGGATAWLALGLLIGGVTLVRVTRRNGRHAAD